MELTARSARELRSVRFHAGDIARLRVVAYPDAEVFDWASVVLDIADYQRWPLK
jgi:hypothetical protein